MQHVILQLFSDHEALVFLYVFENCWIGASVGLITFHMYVSAERISQTIDIVKHTISIEEKGIKLRLTIIDTPGFGDAIDNTEWWGHRHVPAVLFSNQFDPTNLNQHTLLFWNTLHYEESLMKMLCVSISWKQVEDYIDQQFEQYFRDESGLNRRSIQDNRVHCCLYFISSVSHG